MLSIMDFTQITHSEIQKQLDNKKPEELSSGYLNQSGDVQGNGLGILECDNPSVLNPLFSAKEKSMSESRFIKYTPSDKAQWLRENYPNAFLVLSLIAERARRTFLFDGLLIGDALLGNPEHAGLTRKKFDNALDKLVEFGMIEILARHRQFQKVQKRDIKGGIKGTLVNLKDSTIWDINPQIEGHQKVDQRDIKGTSKGHKEECKNEKNERNKNNTVPISANQTEYTLSDNPSKKPKAQPSSDAAALLLFFNQSLKSFIPEVVEMPKDSLAFDGLLKSYSLDEIKKVITFCHTGWWAKHVHTPSYLKRKFPQLLAALRREGSAHSNSQKIDRTQRNKDGTPCRPEYADLF